MEQKMIGGSFFCRTVSWLSNRLHLPTLSSAVDQPVQRTGAGAAGDAHTEPLLAAVKRAEVENGQVQPREVRSLATDTLAPHGEILTIFVSEPAPISLRPGV